VKLFGRDRHPVRINLVTSITAGLTVAGVVGLVGAALRTDILDRQIPLWSFLVAMIISVTVITLTIAGRTARNTNTTAFLLIPALVRSTGFAELLYNVQESFGNAQRDLVIKVPQRNYTSPGQLHHLRKIANSRHEYAGGLVVAAEIETIRTELAKFCGRVRFPVIFTDVEPFESESDYPKNSAYVGYAATTIGEVAGKYVLHFLQAKSWATLTVLVIGSRAQRGRQHRFVEVVSTATVDVHTVVDDDGEFDRLRSREVTRRQLVIARSLHAPFNVIFCTNDEMALGAVDTLRTEVRDGATPDVLVIGVDGIWEALAEIDNGNSPLRATVVQDWHRVANFSVDLLEKKLAGELVPTRTYFRPEIYERAMHTEYHTRK
jgi:ribose transport system substrate-binding protein